MNVLQKLNHHFNNNADYFNVNITLKGTRVHLIGLTSLVDLPRTITLLKLQTTEMDEVKTNAPSLLNPTNHKTNFDIDSLISSILLGNVLICDPVSNTYNTFNPIKKEVTRSIEGPITENALFGSGSSFLEDVHTNVGILRKHVTDPYLKVQSFSVGTNQPKTLILVYIENRVKPELLKNIQTKIEAGLSQNVDHLQHLQKMIHSSSWTFLPKFNSTELPQNAAQALNQGKAILMLDRFPLALILPSLIGDMFCLTDDHNYSLPFMILIRTLRVMGVLIAVLIPGLYVALVSVNPEVLRFELALSVANSRQGVPYPALVETLLLIIVLELILEASVRLPKSVGPTITMVGGIILGQAAVTAKLVSSLLIIILAGTTIASSTVVGFENTIAIRAFKYLLIGLAAIYGMLGILAGIVLICTYMGSQTSLGVPYLSLPKINQRNGR
ncbi:spore germination protein [Paenibacillus sp. Marseille-Q4541]|uniref:spore germination protein n=1 Tax=Paenibacillus sp. Marseille-Q4541 TaxID=2831522 RepID=UPI0032D57A5A